MRAQGDGTGIAGAALLMAVAPQGRERLIEATAVLPALSAVPAAVLTGTAAGSVTQLVNPADPQAVLAQVRTVAQAAGPLTVILVGQLHLDRRAHQPHLALASTRRTTVRYSAFPWEWLRHELRLRPAGSTAVLADLVADEAVWRRFTEDGRPPTLGPDIDLYGCLTPAAARRRVLPPAYAAELAALLRAGVRPPLDQLHRAAAERATLSPDTVLLAPATAHTAPTRAGRREPYRGAGPAGGPAPAEPSATGPVATEPSATAEATEPPATVGAPAEPPAAVRAPAVPAPGVPPVPPRPPAAPVVPARSATAGPDPHPSILEAARAGRHGEAAAMAAAWEQHALRAHGPGSAEAVHWLEVRADLARLAGDPARSCELWLTSAAARLAAGQPPEHPDTEAAVDRAHHQWEQIREPARARALAPQLVAYRQHVPGRQPGALNALLTRVASV